MENQNVIVNKYWIKQWCYIYRRKTWGGQTRECGLYSLHVLFVCLTDSTLVQIIDYGAIIHCTFISNNRNLLRFAYKL